MPDLKSVESVYLLLGFIVPGMRMSIRRERGAPTHDGYRGRTKTE
jgi:hypothetical protein